MAATALFPTISNSFPASFGTTNTVRNSKSVAPTKAYEAQDVTATLHYTSKDLKDLYYYVREPPAGKERSNFEADIQDTVIHDLRAVPPGTLGLDKSGFELYQDGTFHKNAVTGKNESDWFSYELFNSDERIKEEYYPKVRELLKSRLPDLKEVVIFDHTIRRREEGIKDSADKRQPVVSAHVDQTPLAARGRAERHRDLSEHFKNGEPVGRFQLINVWRPLFDGVDDTPLALADYRSVDYKHSDTERERGDLVVSDLIYPEFRGETFRVRHNPAHKWYYTPKQNVDEVILIKCYDSRLESDKEEDKDVAVFTPHTAFTNPRTAPDARPRESIEIRTLVFY